MKTKRWFHASPKRLRIGTLLIGGHRQNYNGSDKNFVYITSEEVPHFTIAEDIVAAKKEVWHVYEVKPHGHIQIGMWNDGIVASATIIRYVGNAKGILNRLRRNTNPRKPKSGSSVKLIPDSIETQWWRIIYAQQLKRKSLDRS